MIGLINSKIKRCGHRLLQDNSLNDSDIMRRVLSFGVACDYDACLQSVRCSLWLRRLFAAILLLTFGRSPTFYINPITFSDSLKLGDDPVVLFLTAWKWRILLQICKHLCFFWPLFYAMRIKYSMYKPASASNSTFSRRYCRFCNWNHVQRNLQLCRFAKQWTVRRSLWLRRLKIRSPLSATTSLR